MRLKIICSLDHEEIPENFRRKILSIFKKGLAETSPNFFEALFGTNKQKNYTWSTFFPQAIFKQGCIIIPEKKFILNFSTGDAEIAVLFQNAFSSLIDEKVLFGKNVLKIVEVTPVSQPFIRSNSVVFRTGSPIVVREHNQETKKDWFHSVGQNQDNFIKVLKQNMLYKWESEYGAGFKEDLAKLEFEPINMKKTVIKHYDKFIEGSIGTFELTGSPYLLNLFQQYGLGSLTGSGMGFIEVVKEG